MNDAGQANPDLNFRYDASLAGYVFNMKTTGLAAGQYLLDFQAGGETYSVAFRVGK